MRANGCKARTDKTGKRSLAGILFFVSAKQPFRSVSVQRFNREQQEVERHVMCCGLNQPGGWPGGRNSKVCGINSGLQVPLLLQCTASVRT